MTQAQGIDELIQQIVKCVPLHPNPPTGPFKFAIDHCFDIRGQGTVLTGTALSGSAKVGDALELPELKVLQQVSSLTLAAIRTQLLIHPPISPSVCPFASMHPFIHLFIHPFCIEQGVRQAQRASQVNDF